MPRPTLAFSLIALAIACAGVPAIPAHADGFVEVATVPGYRFHSVLRVTDGTGPGEMMMVHKSDHHYAIFNIQDGSLKQSFPQYTEAADGSFAPFDVDGDGRSELFFMRWSYIGPGSSFAQFRWNGSSYAPVFDIPEPVPGFLATHLRSTSFVDLIESHPGEVTIRDASTGVAIWRASTSIPGWLGTDYNILILIDNEQDGVFEILITETDSQVPSSVTATHLIKYSGGVFTRLWTAPGRVVEDLLQSDTDPQEELGMQDLTSLSGHKSIVDGLTGLTELDLPTFSRFHVLNSVDLQGNGREEIIGTRQETGDMQVYGYGPGGYAQLFAKTAPYDEWSVVPLRSTTVLDFYELSQVTKDFQVFDANGVVLFTASTSLPGWTGVDLRLGFTDADHDGRLEVILQEGGRVRCVRYDGSFTQAWQVDGAVLWADLGNTDGDPQSELLLSLLPGGGYRLVDGLSGAVEADWPQFTSDNAFPQSIAWLQNGPRHIMFLKAPYSAPLPLTTAYLWDGSKYQAQYALPDDVSYGPIEARSATQDELMGGGVPPPSEPSAILDLIVRDALDGHQLFQASQSLTNWTGLDLNDVVGATVIRTHERDIRRIVLGEPWGTRFLQIAPTLDAPPAVSPTALRVLPSTPNPFREGTELSFELPRAQSASVRILDTQGRLVRRLDGTFPAGRSVVHWDGLDESGRPAPSGVLFYQVQADGMRQSRKLVRID